MKKHRSTSKARSRARDRRVMRRVVNRSDLIGQSRMAGKLSCTYRARHEGRIRSPEDGD